MTYSREALLAWLRNVTPDLRIGVAVVDGARACFAKFTFGGEEYELEALGAEPDQVIVRRVAETIRAAMNLPPLFEPDRQLRLEQDILRASLAGDEAGREALTRTLLQGRKARAIDTKTAFTKREIW